MISCQTDSLTWSADAAGMSLSLRTPLARRIVDAVKQGKTYTVEIKEYRKKRSLNQNDMYWSVLTSFAEALNISNARAHNLLLRRYGQLERYEDKPVYVVLPDTEEAEKRADEAESYHLKPTSQVKEGKDGQMYRTYMLLRGSSTYNTKEMTRLLSGLLDECKEVGIAVMTEREASLLNGS